MPDKPLASAILPPRLCSLARHEPSDKMCAGMQVGEKYGLVRRDVPLFDNNGQLIDLEDRELEPMDVVAAQVRVWE